VSLRWEGASKVTTTGAGPMYTLPHLVVTRDIFFYLSTL
jgi:hypothetical protein